MEWFKKGYSGLVKGGGYLGHILLLIIRLYWGGLLIATGLGKWMSASGVSEYFASLNLPFSTFTAYFVGAVEFFGGIALFLGFLSRPFALLLTILLITAYTVAHKPAVATFFTKPANFTAEQPFLFLYAALIVLCFGPGLFSLDYWLFEKEKRPVK